jgi:glyoxylase-like metal-dependent hydrolase (beta-lactamase superfamily II)
VLKFAPESGLRWGLPFDNYDGPLHYLHEGDIVKLDTDEFKVLFTPGHSPGSVSFYNEKQGFVISGDVLFRNSIGRTDLPGGDHSTLINSIREKLLTLPDATVVYAGHGIATTIGEERLSNPFLQE